MGLSHLDGAHSHGSSGSSFLDGIAQLIAAVVLGVAAIDVVMWLLHILVIIATGVGFLVLGAVGYAAVRYRRHKSRRYQTWAPVYPSPQPNAHFSSYQAVQPAVLPPDRDLHPHLPPGMSGDEVVQIMSRQQRALPGRNRSRWGDSW